MIPQQLEDSLDMLQGCIDCETLMYYEIETFNELHGSFYDEQTIIDEYRQKNGIESLTEEQYREAHGIVLVGDETNQNNTVPVAKYL